LGGLGADSLFGDAGIDRAQYNDSMTGLTADLENAASNTGIAAGDTYNSVENLMGSDYADVLRGNGVANTIYGRDGNDTILGRDGNDILSGGSGEDGPLGGGGEDRE